MANPKPAPLKIGVEPAGVFGMTGFLLGLLISLWNWCEFWFLQGLLLGHCKWKKIKTDKDKKFLRDHPFKTPANFSSFLDPYLEFPTPIIYFLQNVIPLHGWDWNITIFSFFPKNYSAYRWNQNILIFCKKLFCLTGLIFLCEKPFRLMGEIKKKILFLQKVIPRVSV